MNGIPPERRSPVAGEDQLDSIPASAVDEDGSQGFDKYENSLSVHSQSYESALPPPPPQEHTQQPYESALPPSASAMADHHRSSPHQYPYESALPPHHHPMSDHRLSEVA